MMWERIEVLSRGRRGAYVTVGKQLSMTAEVREHLGRPERVAVLWEAFSRQLALVPGGLEDLRATGKTESSGLQMSITALRKAVPLPDREKFTAVLGEIEGKPAAIINLDEDQT